MVVIDVGAHYLGYSSDVCRSFFIDPPPRTWMSAVFSFWNGVSVIFGAPSAASGQSSAELHAEKVRVWNIVLEAQTAAAAAFRANNTAASVDIAARTVIEEAGYGEAFTHRLGHGIGIKGLLAVSYPGTPAPEYLASRSDIETLGSLVPTQRTSHLI
jgi:Xaa-Pro aminopeptidase